MLKYLNMPLVFFLELAMLVAFALFGYRTGSTALLRIGLAILFPAFVIAGWSYWGAPKSSHRLKMPCQVFFRILMFLAASGLFYICRYTTVALIMAALTVVTQTISYFTEEV
jgi:hypothetical protein